MRVKTDNCPFCGSPHLIDSIPSRYGCGTQSNHNRPWTQTCKARQELWPEVQRIRAENARLRDIIRRASTEFCRDGSDGQIAANMFAILSESVESK